MRATLFFRFIVLHVVIFTLLRVIFFIAFNGSDAYTAPMIFKAFSLGFRFDLRLILLVLAPLTVFVWWFSPLSSRFAAGVWRAVYTLVGGVLFLFYFLDFGFYGYLNSRINSAILVFFDNPDISLGMMWQSYPMVWISIAFFTWIFVYSFLLKRFVFYPLSTPFFKWPRWFVNVSFVFVFLSGLYGSISQYPLRWSEAFFSHHHFVSHLSLNPILYFAETYSFSAQQSYNIEDVKKLYPVIKDYVRSSGATDNKYLISRQVKGQSVDHPYNVVVIVMESMAMSKTSLTGNPLNPTPYLAKISQQGVLFNNYYSPCEGTARNMFSIMTAIPDVTKIETSTRNPLVVDQKLIATSYEKYRKMYFLGGSASWANIRGIFSHNIEGIEIVEEGSFKRNKTDVWGISDLDLFIEAEKVFSSVPKKQPFFAVIQTASFHRPYTIPQNALKFKKSKKLSAAQLKEGGFYSQEQFDSLRFSDYSLGHFFELAKNKPYFKNTLFVITGDHGLPDEGGVNVKEGHHVWELEKYHVPLVFVNAQLFPEPKVDERMGGHADLMTSAAMAVGIDHENTTLGRSLWDLEYDKERYSFIYNYYSPVGEFGLIGPRYYYRHDDLKKGQLYDLQAVDPSIDVKNTAPDIYSRMESIAHAQIEFSRYLLFNNQKDKK